MFNADLSTLPAEERREIQEILACDDPAVLLEWLNGCLLDVTRYIRKIAAIIARREELGFQTEVACAGQIGPEMLNNLRLVAQGQIEADLLGLNVRVEVFRAARHLPLSDQRRIVADEPLIVAEPNGDHRKVRPSQMSPREVRQVFDKKSGIRSQAAQVGWLKDQQLKAQAKVKVESDFKIDRKRKGIVIGDKFITRSQLARWLSELN